MTAEGNVSGHSKGPVYIPLPQEAGAGATGGVVEKPLQKGEGVKTGAQAYYTDSTGVSATADAKLTAAESRDLLSKIPPPNAQSVGVSGSIGMGNAAAASAPTGLGNPFLSANPLVAFFMTFNEISNTLKRLSMAQADLSILQMTAATDLSHGIANNILNAAEAEKGMYIASAVASFVEAGTSIMQGMANFKARGAAAKDLQKQNANLKAKAYDGPNSSEAKLNKAIDNQKDALSNVKAKQAELAKAKLDKDPDAIAQAQSNLDDAKFTHRRAMTKTDDADYEHNKNVKEIEKKEDSYLTDLDNATQQRMTTMNMATTFTNKSIDGMVNLIKANLVMVKAQAEAEKEVMSAQQQNLLKTMDLLNNARNENSKLIGDLMQQLRAASDMERKLGGSLGPAAAA